MMHSYLFSKHFENQSGNGAYLGNTGREHMRYRSGWDTRPKNPPKKFILVSPPWLPINLVFNVFGFISLLLMKKCLQIFCAEVFYQNA